MMTLLVVLGALNIAVTILCAVWMTLILRILQDNTEATLHRVNPSKPSSSAFTPGAPGSTGAR